VCTYQDVRYRELNDDHHVLWIYEVDRHENPAALVETVDHYDEMTPLGAIAGQLAERYSNGPNIFPLYCSACGREADYWGYMLAHFADDDHRDRLGLGSGFC
jgi:hypothetical protein